MHSHAQCLGERQPCVNNDNSIKFSPKLAKWGWEKKQFELNKMNYGMILKKCTCVTTNIWVITIWEVETLEDLLL